MLLAYKIKTYTQNRMKDLNVMERKQSSVGGGGVGNTQLKGERETKYHVVKYSFMLSIPS